MSIHAKATVYVGDVGHSFPRSADGPGPGRQRGRFGEESPPRNLDFRRAAEDGDDQGSGADLSPSLIETRAAAGTRMFSQTPDSRHPQSLFRKDPKVCSGKLNGTEHPLRLLFRFDSQSRGS